MLTAVTFALGNLLPIAGFGHVAVGLVSGRLYAESSGRKPLLPLLLFPVLALLPDFDVFPLAFGVPDASWYGHRGWTHTPVFALLCGAVVWLWRRGREPQPLRTAIGITLVVASHALLDALAQDGRGMMFLWPLSEARHHMPWRPIPDAPVGLALFTELGARHIGIELVYFFPFTLYALWPRRRSVTSSVPGFPRARGPGRAPAQSA